MPPGSWLGITCGTTRISGISRSPCPPRLSSGRSCWNGRWRLASSIAFLRGEDGRWRAKWLHFYLKGPPTMNVVQGNWLSTSLLARTVVERDYLRVGYLAGLTGARTTDGAFVAAATPDDLTVAAKDAPGP